MHRHFFSTDVYEVVGNQQFFDNGKTYPAWPDDPEQKYSFGAVFLLKRGDL